jgi:hypothetical protein
MKSLPLLIFIFSCATTPKMSMQQRRSLQMRSFDASYDNVFKSTKSVLQDDGYIIKNQDYQGGMILAQKETSTRSSWTGILGVMSAGNNKNTVTGNGYEVSFNLDKISKNNIETRLTLQQATFMSNGGKSGKEIVDAKLYKSIYDRLSVEIERRKAKGI